MSPSYWQSEVWKWMPVVFGVGLGLFTPRLPLEKVLGDAILFAIEAATLLQETSVLERLIPLSRLIIHFVLVRKPSRPEDSVIHSGCFDHIGSPAKWRKIRTDLATIPCTEFAGNFVVYLKRSYKDESFYPSRIHRFNDIRGLSIDVASVRLA
jgi:hypothetical protein